MNKALAIGAGALLLLDRLAWQRRAILAEAALRLILADDAELLEECVICEGGGCSNCDDTGLVPHECVEDEDYTF